MSTPDDDTISLNRSDTEEEYLRHAIGSSNTHYYLDRFAELRRGGIVSWNWPAFFFTLYWLAYRKMWLYAVLYVLVLPIVLLIATALVAAALQPYPVAAGAAAVTLCLATMFVVCPMFANALYHGHVKRKIDAARARSPANLERQLGMLAAAGGTSIAAVLAAAGLQLVPGLGMVAAIAIPAYRDYTVRAQVSEGLNLARVAQAAVTEAIGTGGEAPVDAADAGLTTAGLAGRFVRAVDVRDGRIDITFSDGAAAPIAGGRLSLTPYAVDLGGDELSVIWRCGNAAIPPNATYAIAEHVASSMPARYLPSACR